MTRANARQGQRRRGFSLLEVQVAFVLLGVGLAGVCPLVAMQLRLARKIERGFGSPGPGIAPYDSRWPDDTTFLFLPASNPWARKFGGSATATALSAIPGGVPGSVYSTGAAMPALSVMPPVERSGGSLTLRVQRTVVESGGGGTP